MKCLVINYRNTVFILAIVFLLAFSSISTISSNLYIVGVSYIFFDVTKDKVNDTLFFDCRTLFDENVHI